MPLPHRLSTYIDVDSALREGAQPQSTHSRTRKLVQECGSVPGLAVRPNHRPQPKAPAGIEHRHHLARLFAVPNQLDGRGLRPLVNTWLPADVFGDLGGAVVGVVDLVARPELVEHLQHGATLRHAGHQFVTEEQQPTLIQVDHRATIGPNRIDPIVRRAGPQLRHVAQCQLRSADQRVEHAVAGAVRVIQPPVLVFDDDEVRPIPHIRCPHSVGADSGAGCRLRVVTEGPVVDNAQVPQNVR